MSLILRSKLCVMMFLQFMLVASFWVQLSTYLNKMEVKGVMFSLIMSTMAIGSIFSPLVGMFADRVANSEKVLCVLNALVAGLLLAAFFTTNPTMIFVWLVLAMCAYMPTWGLTASIAMANSTPEAFPIIRVFGSLGWICAAVFALVGKSCFGTVIDGTATPPKAKGEPMSAVDALGLRAFSMLKDKNVAVFMASVVIWTVAFTIYWMYGSFLSSLGVEDITASLSVGQVSELVFMTLLPIAIVKIGFKKTLAIGILAMLVRYVLSGFAPETHSLYWGAIAVHGIIFGFFFVAAQMYIDKKASDDIKAQAQGLFFFFYGVAQIIGTFFSEWLISSNTNKAVEGVVAKVGATTTDWQNIFFIEAGICAFLLVFFCFLFKDDTKNA